MVDLENTSRKVRRFTVIFGCACAVVILLSGVAIQLWKGQARPQQQPTILGRLHVKYSPEKETPWVDVAADRDTLNAWRGIFVGPDGPHTTEDIAYAYGKLAATGKLTSVDPDTLVRIMQREQPNDCFVTILYGDKREQSGWVDCRWITN